jgi:hypothetical protein
VSESLIAVYRDYQMDPAFHRLRENASWFAYGGKNLSASLVFVFDTPLRPESLVPWLIQNSVALDDCYVTSLIKYAGVRPAPGEIRASRDYLAREMAALNPEVLCAMGPLALGSFVDTAPPWHHTRGRFYTTKAGTYVVPVHHGGSIALALRLCSKEFTRRG